MHCEGQCSAGSQVKMFNLMKKMLESTHSKQTEMLGMDVRLGE